MKMRRLRRQRPESEKQERQRLARTGLGVRETSAGPGGRKHSPEVVGRATSFLAAARAVDPTGAEQPGPGRPRCGSCLLG